MNDWPVVSLGEVCTFRYGKSLPAAIRETGPFQVYGSNGPVGEHSKALVDGPVIVIGRKGSLGEVRYSEGSAWPIDTTYFVDQTAAPTLDMRWLFYRLGSLGLTKLNRAAAIPGLNREDAYRIRFAIPPVEEQQRIAAILDQADAIRAKRRQALAHLDALPQAIFRQVFGDPRRWKEPLVPLGDLAVSVDYGTSAKSGRDGAWPILRMGNITDDGRISLDDLKFGELSEAEVVKYSVRRGDLIFNRTNSVDKVGKSAAVHTDEHLAIAGYLIRVRFDDSRLSDFVSTYLQTAHGRGIRRSLAKAAVNQANISASQMKSIRVTWPTADALEKFADSLATIRAQRERVERQLAADDELFASLQARAFRGDL